jgi:hypothetical protein
MGAAPGLAAKRWRTGARVLDTASVSRGPGGVSWAGLGKAVSVSIVGGLGEGEEGLGRGRVPSVVVVVGVVNRSFHSGHCMIIVLTLEGIFPRLDDSVS